MMLNNVIGLGKNLYLFTALHLHDKISFCIFSFTGNSLPNWTQKVMTGKDGAFYEQHGGLSLRSQMFPNAVNVPSYGLKTILSPGEIYYHETIFKFGTFIPNRRNKQDD